MENKPGKRCGKIIRAVRGSVDALFSQEYYYKVLLIIYSGVMKSHTDPAVFQVITIIYGKNLKS